MDLQDKLYSRGKIIVIAFMIYHTFSTLVSYLYEGVDIIATIILVVMLIALYKGATWAKILFVVKLGIMILAELYLLLGDVISAPDEWSPMMLTIFKGYLVVDMIVNGVFAYLLFVNKAVQEFQYVQKNG